MFLRTGRTGVSTASGARTARLRPISTYITRSYHARDHIISNIVIDDLRVENKILSKSLQFIPQYGFNQKCITKAIQDLHYPDSMMSVISASSNGNSSELQLMLHWLKTQRVKLDQEVRDPKSEVYSIENEYERAAFLINKRLSYNEPILGQLLGGIAQLMVPYNMPYSWEELYNLGDDLAYYAGDLSNDFSWYAKRFSLSTVYVSAELYMLQDKSPGFADTKQFVKEKVENIDQLGTSYENIEQWAVFNGIGVWNLVKSQLARG